MRMIEAGKSLLIVALTALMIVLGLRLWLDERAGTLGVSEQGTRAPTAGYHTAAYPLVIVAGGGAEAFGIHLNMDGFMAEYQRLSSWLGEALSSADAPVPAGRQDWEQAVNGPFVLFEYLDPVPLRPLAAWLVKSPSDLLGGDARRILLAQTAYGTCALYIETGAGELLRYGTSLSVLPEPAAGVACRFAFEQGRPTSTNADPFTVLFPGFWELPVWEWSPAGGGRDAYLREFRFPRVLTEPYREPGGASVFVDGPRILRFLPDGRLEYRDGSAYPESAGQLVIPLGDSRVTDEDRIEAAMTLALAVMPGASAPGEDIAVRLAAVRPISGSRVEVSLRLFLNGVPLSEATARVVFEGDVIVGAELPLRRYAWMGVSPALMPAEQAAAAMVTPGRPIIALNDENGNLVPKWLVW